MNCENEAVSLVLGVNVIDPIMDSLDNAPTEVVRTNSKVLFQFCPNGDEQLNTKSPGLRGVSPRQAHISCSSWLALCLV
jgi:hypothetical protein